MPQAPVRPQRRREDWRAREQDRPSLSPTWDTAVEKFLRDTRARNCSQATLENYKNYLLGPRSRQFLTDYQIRSVSDVTVDMLRNFQHELLEAGPARRPPFTGSCGTSSGSAGEREWASLRRLSPPPRPASRR